MIGLGENPLADKICNCRNSKCMKLYCQCYSAGQECNKNCKCIDCKNQKDSEILKALKGFAVAVPLKNQKLQGIRQNKGCSCRKSFCIKKYCQCFQDGLLCGEHCKCVQCQNTQSMTNRNVILNLKKTNSNSGANKSCILYPIILSQSAEHINHLANEENAYDLDDKDLEGNVGQLFQVAESGEVVEVINTFLNILKRIDNKGVKIQEQRPKLEQ